MSVHNPAKQLKRATDGLKQAKISERNKQLIGEYIDFLSLQGVKELRKVKYIYTLEKIASWLKMDFDEATKKDIEKLCSTINNNEYTDWTKHDYRVTIKKFYTWLRNKDNDDIDEWETPKEVRWIKIKAPRDSKKVPSDLLTPKDIQLLSEHTKNLREKALLLTLYESGARIGEILNLRVKDVTFDEYGAQLNLNGKTGYRKIRIVGSSPAISQWLQLEHPKRNDKMAYLFCNINNDKGGEQIGGMLSYDAAKKILHRIADRAKFTKKINPHLFRHSRATELAEFLNDAPLCNYFGWKQGSQMSRVYTHIQDTDRLILEMNGLVKKEKSERGHFKEIVCPRCNTKNPYGSKFCSGCSLGLDVKNLIETEKTAKAVGFNILELLKNPDFVIRFGNQLAEEYAKQQKEKV